VIFLFDANRQRFQFLLQQNYFRILTLWVIETPQETNCGKHKSCYNEVRSTRMNEQEKARRNQWHPGCCRAIKLELREGSEHLAFEQEHIVNSKPIQIDLLIIKKADNIVTANDIGKIFRGHNIIEFKSPEDSLNYDTYIKGIGYACIYKANEEHIDDIQMDDITLTFLRNKKPQKLIRKLIQEGDARRLAQATRTLSRKCDIDNADAVINVTMKANREFFEKIKEDETMCEALREFFRPELEEAVKQTNYSVIEKMLRKGKTPEEIHDLLDYPMTDIEEVANQILIATK
jgi:hypothetical protein